MLPVQNLNIKNIKKLDSPNNLKSELPSTILANQVVVESRNEIKSILDKTIYKPILIVGPCSIHDENMADEYANKLSVLQQQMKDRLCIIMRVYFEKPRTTIGWKGLINDPHLNGTNDIPLGLKLARRVLLSALNKGLPTATEFLDPIIPQYISDLISWAAIGARTTESQTHREMSSGLSMPVGFKNTTEGNIQIAVDAVQSAYNPHHFLGINQDGIASLVSTKGNPYCHIILRGGKNKTNYDIDSIQEASQKLEAAKMKPNIMIDCSHANSEKKFAQQEQVWKDTISLIKKGNKNIIGLMLESNINEGNQSLPQDLSTLKHGVSITDACVSFETTQKLLEYAYNELN